ncbi:MAG: LapA family protein [Cyanobacteria bacterium P01_D01_bin.50]
MKTTLNLLVSAIIALWIVAIAIISVQNATPVSLRFLTFESIQIPVGLVLAFCVGFGFIGTTILKTLWSISNIRQSNSQRYEDDVEFFVDEDL